MSLWYYLSEIRTPNIYTTEPYYYATATDRPSLMKQPIVPKRASGLPLIRRNRGFALGFWGQCTHNEYLALLLLLPCVVEFCETIRIGSPLAYFQFLVVLISSFWLNCGLIGLLATPYCCNATVQVCSIITPKRRKIYCTFYKHFTYWKIIVLFTPLIYVSKASQQEKILRAKRNANYHCRVLVSFFKVCFMLCWFYLWVLLNELYN